MGKLNQIDGLPKGLRATQPESLMNNNKILNAHKTMPSACHNSHEKPCMAYYRMVPRLFIAKFNPWNAADQIYHQNVECGRCDIPSLLTWH